MSIRNDDFINRIGISNTENVRFNKLHNKFNVFQNQTITPSESDGTLSTYVLNNELYYDNKIMTSGGSISGGGTFEVVDGTITQKTTNIYPCQFQDQSISSISSGDFGTLTSIIGSITNLYSTTASITSSLFSSTLSSSKGTISDLYGTTATISSVFFSTLSSSKGTITDLYSTNATITSIAVDTIAMSGSTRTVSNIAGISFTAVSTYITGLKSLTFSTGSSINDLVTLNSVNNNMTNCTIDNIFGGKNDGTRDYVEIGDGDYILSPEIQVNNGTGDAKMYSNQYYIGTPASNQSLANYIKSEYSTNLGTLTGVSISAGIGGSPFGYLTSAIVPAQNVSGYTDYNGLKCDVIECDEFLKANNLVCNNLYSNQGGGTSFLDFLTGVGGAIGGIGNVVAGASNLCAGGLVLGGGIATGTGLIAVAISPSGNGYYNQHSFNWEQTEWNSAAEECGMTSPYVIFGTREYGPTERKQMASFLVNPRSGRISIATWGQTEDSRTLSGENDVQWCDSAYINAHDNQYSISFKNYSDATDFNENAFYATTCTYDGGNLVSVGYTDRLVNLNGRLYFNGSSNKLAYTSEIPAASTNYWELDGGYLQPNASSGFTGAMQLTSDVMNVYTDIYLSTGHQLNFIASTKAHIKYDDTAKTLTFQNADAAGEFIFNNYLGVAQMKIDTSNNRLELPTGGLYFQESGDQKIRKAGSGLLQISSIDNTEFLIGPDEEKIITLNEPTRWFSGYEYPIMTLKDERTESAIARTSTQIQLISPNASGTCYFRVDNSLNGGYANVFYSRRQGTVLGNEYNYFFDTPKTKFNSIQFTDMGTATISSGLEFTSSVGINALKWYGDIVLTDNAPNISNRITFTDITLTNTGLERNGSDLYWDGSKLNSQAGSAYFTDDSTTATSVALDFTFSQDVFVSEQFSTGAINSRINLTASAANEISQITMCNLKPFITYNTTAGQEHLYIDYHCGTDADDNINIRMGATPDLYIKIIPDSTTIYNDLIIDTGENLTLTQGDLILSNGNATISGDLQIKSLKIISSNIATNYFSTSMTDSSMAFHLTGGSNPDAFWFKDYDSANICKIQRDNFTFYGSDTNSKFNITSSEINCYNDMKFPSADIYLEQGSSDTTSDSNFIQLGKWRIQQRIVPYVEFQALRFEFDPATGGKGAYILRSRTDGALFTGIHRNSVEKPNPQFVLRQGMILISTGVIRNYDKPDIVTIDQTLPVLTTSSKPNDKAVFGIYAGQKELVDLYINGNMATEMTPLISDDRRALVNGSGEGAVLVNNDGGNIEVGDLIVSSSRLGIGMKQSDDIIRNYSVAKATTSHDFNNNYDEVLIGCIYLM